MSLRRRSSLSRRMAVSTLAILTIAGMAGCSGNPMDGDGGTDGADAVVVGSANFPESQTIAEIYAAALNAGGVSATTRPNIGAREVYVTAVQDGSVDLVPEYSGNLLRYVAPDSEEVAPEEVLTALRAALPDDLKVLDAAQAEDKDSIVVTQATAAKYGLTSLSDLGKVCSQVAIGMPPEAEERPQGLPGLKKLYDCVPGEFVPLSDQGGPITLKALLDDRVQAANIFSTTPSITANNLVTLDDPKHLYAAQQVLPLVRTDALGDKATSILNKVSAKLTTDDLLQLNEAVSGAKKQNPADAAKDWVTAQGLG